LPESSKEEYPAVLCSVRDDGRPKNPVDHGLFVELLNVEQRQLRQIAIEVPGGINHAFGIAGKSTSHFEFEVVPQEARGRPAFETTFTEGDWHRCRPPRRDHGC
jgi:hypothetical protein